MKQSVVFACILMLCVSGVAEETSKSESLLGKPVTVLLPESLADYEIKISQPKSRNMLSEADVRHAILLSKLIDPTLPRVRHNHWPIGAEVQLRSTKQPAAPIIHIRLAGLGLLTDRPVTYVFEYATPKRRDQPTKPSTVTE